MEEFYEVVDSSFELAELRGQLLEWERICDTVRPNQALGYLTPLQFLQQRQENQRKEVGCPQSYGRVQRLDVSCNT